MKVYDPDSPTQRDADDVARQRDLLGWDDEAPIRVHGVWFRLARGFIVFGLIALVLWMAYSRARTWFDEQLDPPGEPGEAIALVVPAGATTADIARQLEDLEVIPNSTFFRYYARAKDEGNFQAGEYTMPTNASVEEAIAVLNAGPKPHETTRFTVREGLWEHEVLASIASQLDNVTEADLRDALDSGRVPARYRPDGVSSWEGLLYPETYEVNTDDTAEEVLLKMTDEFSKVTGELGFGAADSILGYSAYDVLIVASLIEAEAALPEERPLVASVIYNRLREGWILGIDATCVYGTGQRGVELTQEVLDTEGPYNCRLNTGLPPTPINSPGAASLAAALQPAETDYMYYVLTGEDGTQTFATTEEEFLAAKAICQEKGLC
ncbi:MAG: endolytic transglycosylase MltG [Acidimicrobiales bacterium]